MQLFSGRAVRWVGPARLYWLDRNLRFPPEWPCRRTLKRRLNLYLNRWEYARVRTRLRSYPWMLSIEPTNACNLHCPFCFTGAGGLGRPRSAMSLELYRKLLDELGGYLILLKAYSWGEPLLCRHLETMIAEAHARGICTVVNTNFSLPFEARRAEAFVASGLDHLVISIDGTRQDTYQRYRVGGSLARVLENTRLMIATKHRLGSEKPTLTLEFHPFPWNTQDVPAMRALAAELGTALHLFKGCLPGEEWGKTEPWQFCGDPTPMACVFPWSTAVVAGDGGVAACIGSFYAEDDMGRLDPGAPEHVRFRDIWNNERYRLARSFFHAREGTDKEREHICFDCPNTKLWERWQGHRAAGGDRDTFEIGFTTNDTWNYFWERRPETALRVHGRGELVPGQRKLVAR